MTQGRHKYVKSNGYNLFIEDCMITNKRKDRVMISSTSYGVTIEQLRIDIVNAVQSYFMERDWFKIDLFVDMIVREVDDKKFRRTDGIDGRMYLYVYADGSMSVDYNVLDHFKVNDKLVFRWDVCGNDKLTVVLYDYSKK